MPRSPSPRPEAAVRTGRSKGDVRRACVLPGLVAGAHAPHALHGPDACWRAKNRHVDPWIELLAVLGLDPHALWPCAVALDFEGDQWTLLKPPHGELRALYGVDVQELAVRRPLAKHAIEHLAAGRLLSLEADAFWLPDTAGAGDRTNHSKTTIVLNEVDLDACRIAYFHAAGYFEARGDDVAHLLGPEDDTSAPQAVAALGEWRLPPHVEFIRTTRRVERSTDELRMLALHHLETHLAFRPATNPVRRFAAGLAGGQGDVEQWASATMQQLGAAFELAARGLAWHDAPAASPLHDAARAFDQIACDAKTLEQKLACAATSTRPAGVAPLLEPMAQAWDAGMAALEAAVRR